MGLEQTERWIEARQAYSQAADRWPHNETAWIGLGNSRYALGNLAGAEQAFRSAVDAAPQSGAAYNNLAHILMERGRQEEALEVINQAVRLGGSLTEVFQKTRSEIQQRTLRQLIFRIWAHFPIFLSSFPLVLPSLNLTL